MGKEKLNYQTNKLIEAVLFSGQGSMWHRSGPTFYADLGKSYNLRELTPDTTALIFSLDQGFEDGEIEMVSATTYNWFDEGGQAVDILIAKKQASSRVWRLIDAKGDTQAPVISALFWLDFNSNPEEYILLTSGPE